ncbi:hypothetical protein FQA39_LY17780 [Lamprigera yunnana]|nr:hypothetical protein FQA39_LY17780 [Lamprigera yunnana]
MLKYRYCDGYGFKNKHSYGNDLVRKPAVFQSPYANFNVDLIKKKFSSYGYSVTNTKFNSKAEAKSSLSFGKMGLKNIQLLAQDGYVPHLGYRKSINSRNKTRFGFRNNIQGSLATAALAPKMIHQSVALFPNAMNTPDFSIGGKPSGSNYGIYTSSESVNTNQNGRPVQYQHAATAINHNGRFITQSLRYP